MNVEFEFEFELPIDNKFAYIYVVEKNHLKPSNIFDIRDFANNLIKDILKDDPSRFNDIFFFDYLFKLDSLRKVFIFFIGGRQDLVKVEEFIKKQKISAKLLKKFNEMQLSKEFVLKHLNDIIYKKLYLYFCFVRNNKELDTSQGSKSNADIKNMYCEIENLERIGQYFIIKELFLQDHSYSLAFMIDEIKLFNLVDNDNQSWNKNESKEPSTDKMCVDDVVYREKLSVKGEVKFVLGLLKLRYFKYRNETDNDSFSSHLCDFIHSEYYSVLKFDKAEDFDTDNVISVIDKDKDKAKTAKSKGIVKKTSQTTNLIFFDQDINNRILLNCNRKVIIGQPCFLICKSKFYYPYLLKQTINLLDDLNSRNKSFKLSFMNLDLNKFDEEFAHTRLNYWKLYNYQQNSKKEQILKKKEQINEKELKKEKNEKEKEKMSSSKQITIQTVRFNILKSIGNGKRKIDTNHDINMTSILKRTLSNQLTFKEDDSPTHVSKIVEKPKNNNSALIKDFLLQYNELCICSLTPLYNIIPRRDKLNLIPEEYAFNYEEELCNFIIHLYKNFNKPVLAIKQHTIPSSLNLNRNTPSNTKDFNIQMKENVYKELTKFSQDHEEQKCLQAYDKEEATSETFEEATMNNGHSVRHPKKDNDGMTNFSSNERQVIKKRISCDEQATMSHKHFIKEFYDEDKEIEMENEVNITGNEASFNIKDNDNKDCSNFTKLKGLIKPYRKEDILIQPECRVNYGSDHDSKMTLKEMKEYKKRLKTQKQTIEQANIEFISEAENNLISGSNRNEREKKVIFQINPIPNIGGKKRLSSLN